MKRSAKTLIDERLNEMPMDSEVEFSYVCMDTGMSFETYDEPAAFSPFTGSSNISSTDDEVEDDYYDYAMDDPYGEPEVAPSPEPISPYGVVGY